MDKETSETVVYAVKGSAKLALNGHYVEIPEGWELVPSGDAALTRRLKAAASDYWVVKRKAGGKEFGIGLCVPAGLADAITRQLSCQRATPEYQRKLDAGRLRRAKEQREYQSDFQYAVLEFLQFHPRWKELALQLAKTITQFTTPVGSGTVARTQRIPIEQRARAAVIAWMRHNTTDYDKRYIPHVAGKRRKVRRDIAHCSVQLLNAYRQGQDAPENCPLQAALAQQPTTEKNAQLQRANQTAETAHADSIDTTKSHGTTPTQQRPSTAPHTSASRRITRTNKPLNTRIDDGDFFS